MSDNYKTIARARDIAKALRAEKWSDAKIQETIGLAFKLYREIMEQDPVSVSIRTPSVEKLKRFIEDYEHWLDKPPAETGVNVQKKKDPPHSPEPPKGSDPLAELDALVEKFASRGYKLETRIIKMVQ